MLAFLVDRPKAGHLLLLVAVEKPIATALTEMPVKLLTQFNVDAQE